MKYQIVERNIGRAGNRQQMAKKQADWNKKYGEGNWLTGYEINGQFKTREEVIEEIYDQSYFVFLDQHPEVVSELQSAAGVFNPHALLSNSVDIQAATVERYMKARNLSFNGIGLLPIGSYQPKWKKETVLPKAIELGLKVEGDKIIYPKIAYTLNPFSVPCIVNPTISIEAFWQSDIKCLAIKSSDTFSTQVGDVFEFAPERSVICITTNGERNKLGEAIMGKGIAKIAKTQLKPVKGDTKIEVKLGEYLLRNGNRAFHLGQFLYKPNGKIFTIVSFPTKTNWSEPSNPNLIEKSCKELLEMAAKFNWNTIYLPVPGGDNGKLNWKQVKPLLKELDNRFTIVSDKANTFHL